MCVCVYTHKLSVRNNYQYISNHPTYVHGDKISRQTFPYIQRKNYCK